MRRTRLSVLLLTTSLYLGLVAMLAAKVAGETADDFFITYRYAQNLASGDGYVFKSGRAGAGHQRAGPWTPLFVLLGTLGLMPLAWRGGREARLLALTAPLIVAAYPLLGVPFYTWYSIPVLVPLLYGQSFLAGEGLRRSWRMSSWRRLTGTAIVLALVAPVGFHV